MSSVYRAEDLANKRTVALKLPAGGSSASEQALLRFRREARLAASIAHPNCVLVYGALELRGSPAIAMEWVPGGTLQERTAAGTIPIEQAVEWTMQVIDGLEAAWSAGILHRDVKPANCFVGADGEAKVGDFGLSKSFEQPSDLTVSGAFLGTPLYASPEQVRGRELDHRTDIYSVGATLLERVVVKAMAKDPKERYETYAEFRAALLPFGPRIEVPGNPAFRLAAWLVDSLLLSPIYLVWWLLSAAGVEGAHFEDGFPANTLLWNSYSFLLWLLYYSLLERGGRASLGKRLFALRVKASDGTDPPLGRVFLRSALYMAAFIQSDADPFWWLLPLLTATIVLPSSFRKTGFRGIHELLSKTRVVRSHPRQRRITQGVRTRATRITDAPMELAGAMKLLRRIPFPGVGEFLEGYEPELERRVLVHRLPADVPLFPAEVRQPSGLKLLRQIKAASGTYHVYEAIGGEPLRERLARGPFERWEDGCELVSDLIRVC
jgi:serine/threonine protein kinase